MMERLTILIVKKMTQSNLQTFKGHENLEGLSRDELEFVRQVRLLSFRCKAINGEARRKKIDRLAHPYSIVHNGDVYIRCEDLNPSCMTYHVTYSNWLLCKYDAAVARCRFFSPQAKSSVRALIAAGLINPLDIVACLLAEDGYNNFYVQSTNIF